MKSILALFLFGPFLFSFNSDGVVVSASDETPRATKRSTRDASGRTKIQQIQESFDRQGYIVLRNVLNPDTILKEWVNFEQAFFPEIFQKLHEFGHTPFPLHSRVVHGHQQRQNSKRQYALQPGKKNGFSEIVMRSDGRYDISLTKLFDAAAPGAQGAFATPQPSVNPILEKLSSLIPELLHTNDTMAELNINPGLVVSTPGASDQSWHSDGPHVDMAQHLPCHILNIFIPLVDVTEMNGPTEIVPGSHYVTRQPPPMQIRSDQVNEPVAPELKVGDVLIFDYRTLHRGKANLSKYHRRPVLIFTISRSDFVDTVNFAETKSIFTAE